LLYNFGLLFPPGEIGCDTLVATATGTADRSVLFAKNSDRLPDECQHLRVYPSRDWDRGATVRCQYVTLPQVRRTYRVLGSRPFWLWGFEHGVNERGGTAREALDVPPAGDLFGGEGQHRLAVLDDGHVEEAEADLGYAWWTATDGRRHVRVVGWGFVPQPGLWGGCRGADAIRGEERVSPDLARRVAALWGHDDVVVGLLPAARDGSQDALTCRLVLADRLAELGAEADAALVRHGRWRMAPPV
jgi:hypothetical protein